MSTDMEIGRLQGAIKATQEQQDRDRSQNNERFDRIDSKLGTQDSKLDQLLAAQASAATIRVNAEKRQDARARAIAIWTSFGTGFFLIALEVMRWAISAKVHHLP